MNKLKILVGKGSTFYDISELVGKTTWSGRKGAAPRTVEVTVYDSESLKKRVPVDCGAGQTLALYENGKELFRGLLVSEKYSVSRVLTLKAFDMCIRLTNNKSSFSYKKKTASQIFRDCCSKLGLSTGTVASTGHTIGELVKKNTTYWDVIEDALSQTYKTTGKRFYVYAEKGKVNLVQRKEQSTMPVLDLKTSVESYDRTRSIENTRTRLKLVTSKGKTKSSTVVSSLESKIGKFQEVESVDEKITKTEIKQRVNEFKTEKAVVGQTLKITATGISSVKAGGCVYVNISTIDTKRIFYVEEDTHTWEKGGHKMTIGLDYMK